VCFKEVVHRKKCNKRLQTALISGQVLAVIPSWHWMPFQNICYFLGMTLNCIHIFIVTDSFLYWCVMRPASQRFFTHSCIYLRILIISYLATFLGTNSLSVLMCRKAVNQSSVYKSQNTSVCKTITTTILALMLNITRLATAKVLVLIDSSDFNNCVLEASLIACSTTRNLCPTGSVAHPGFLKGEGWLNGGGP